MIGLTKADLDAAPDFKDQGGARRPKSKPSAATAASTQQHSTAAGTTAAVA